MTRKENLLRLLLALERLKTAQQRRALYQSTPEPDEGLFRHYSANQLQIGGANVYYDSPRDLQAFRNRLGMSEDSHYY